MRLGKAASGPNQNCLEQALRCSDHHLGAVTVVENPIILAHQRTQDPLIPLCVLLCRPDDGSILNEGSRLKLLPISIQDSCLDDVVVLMNMNTALMIRAPIAFRQVQLAPEDCEAFDLLQELLVIIWLFTAFPSLQRMAGFEFKSNCFMINSASSYPSYEWTPPSCQYIVIGRDMPRVGDNDSWDLSLIHI